MAAGAYLLLPISGLFAYLKGRDARIRFHGLQALFLGFLWPALTWIASFVAVSLTQMAFGLGGLVWLGVMLATAAGRDPSLPGIGPFLREIAEEPPSGN